MESTASPRQQKANAAGAVSSQPVTLDSTPLDWSCLVACVGCNGGATCTGITQSGVTWGQLVASSVRKTCEIWMALPKDVQSASASITISWSGGAGGKFANISEWSGIRPTGANDNTNSADGSSTNPASPSVTPSGIYTPNALIVACVLDAGGSSTAPTNGFTALTEALSTQALDSAYKVVNAAGAVSTAWTNAVSAAWESEIVAIRAWVRPPEWRTRAEQAVNRACTF